MPKEITIRGETTEKKFKHIERILQRFSRRLHKTVIGAMPPIPLLFHIDKVPESGEVTRCLLPCDGRITNVCMHINEFHETKEAEFMATVISSGGNRTLNFSTKKHLLVDRINLPVVAGDLLVLMTNQPNRVSDISVALLLEVGLKDMNKEVFLIEAFEKVIDEEVEEDENAS